MADAEVVRRISVSLVDGELAFTPDPLNVFRSGKYPIAITLDDSVPKAIKYEKPYILFPLGSPFSVQELSPDERSLILEGTNEATARIEPYPYRLVLGPRPVAKEPSDDPSIINHGMEGRE